MDAPRFGSIDASTETKDRKHSSTIAVNSNVVHKYIQAVQLLKKDSTFSEIEADHYMLEIIKKHCDDLLLLENSLRVRSNSE